jgi:hypothetical protein
MGGQRGHAGMAECDLRHRSCPLPTPCGSGSCGAGDICRGSGHIGHGGAPVIDGATMTVHQLSDQAILIGTILLARQDGCFRPAERNRSTLNCVWVQMPARSPASEGNGQVYLINQNGFTAFAERRASQCRSLVASTRHQGSFIWRLARRECRRIREYISCRI